MVNTSQQNRGEKEGSDQQRTADRGLSTPPAISLPKSGGAIRGIGEKFAANPVTGTGSLSVPIYTSPGRSGFGPQLSLSYDSGAGNGLFGFGWHLALPAITRKTDKGLPKYQDAEASDVFILSGAEDLVPVLVDIGGQWQPERLPPRTVDGETYQIQRYQPRIEGLFARIERWTNTRSGEAHWRSISSENITTLYGKTAESRIADPADPQRVFSWLVCETYDDKGNAICYKYKSENSQGVEVSLAHERNRSDLSRSANRYLKRIQYGNKTPRVPGEALSQRTDWRLEVVFDYGEHDPGDPTPTDAGQWLCRHDPFSAYRAGFEVRTYRLCQRVLMFHHFPDEEGVGQDCLVRSTDFVYRDIRNNPEDRSKGPPIASFIASITQSGYKRQAGGYLKKSLPPLEFEYSRAEIHDEFQEIDAVSLENLPYGLDGSSYQWVDLDGEGISGLLTEQGNGWFYKRNHSPVHHVVDNGIERTAVRFGPAERVATKPAASLAAGRAQFMDLAGDGQLDLVQFDVPVPGFYERTDDAGWVSFHSFVSWPNLDTRDPKVKFIDLDGDGHTDVLVSEDEVFSWYSSLAERGFSPSQRVHKPDDEEQGPRLVFADGTQSIYLTDLSGDGLTDLVRIRNGDVCYWPNLGYGHFGTKVTMDNAPWFDVRDQFSQQRIRLADIDGSGTTDIIYLGRETVDIYRNQAGNSWSQPDHLTSFPPVDNLSSVTAVDLLGNGTACLVWSSPLPADKRRPMGYIDLMGGQKPHLLVSVKNNLGTETHVRYAPSTKFYLEDKAAGKPWITRLPFPVQVVERVETYDRISRNRFVTRYAYHHGFFDGIEREFRGFGMVEQYDTEELAVLNAIDAFPSATNIDETSHVPPVLTKTWFHTGAYVNGEHISTQFEAAYYREGDPSLGESELTDEQRNAMLLPDTVLPGSILRADGTRMPWTLSPEETRQAYRALKGSILRQEVYAVDRSEEADRPYHVSERNYTIELMQPMQPGRANQHAVFFTHLRETIDFHYERKLYDVAGNKLADPRVSHAMTLAVDYYGNVLKSVAIGYGRRLDDPSPLLTTEDRDKQRLPQLTYTENCYTNSVLVEDPVLVEDAYRTPMLCETRTYELLKVQPQSAQPNVTNLFRFEEVVTRVQEAGAHDIPYEDVEATTAVDNHPYRRLVEHGRTLYRPDDCGIAQGDALALLPLGQLERLALPGESYTLALTPGLLTQVYGPLVTDSILQNEGRYVHSEGDANWWVPSGRVFYSPNDTDTPGQELAFARQHFFLLHRFRDPFHTNQFKTETVVRYDAQSLLVTQTTDPVGNIVQAQNDYRVLQPELVTDPNGNRSQVAFDALGMMVGTAVMGKVGESVGDSLVGFDADLNAATIQAHINDPLVDPHAILQKATTRLVYDLDAYHRTQSDPQPQPPVVYTLARETHDADLALGENEKTRVQHSFSYSDGFGREVQKKVQAEPERLPDGSRSPNPRWVGSGWTVFNNKGKPIRQYEPFFSATHVFEFAKTVGVSPILFYDPVERVVATLHPNYTWEKVVFDPWRQEVWDVNDTVLVADPKSDPDVGDFFCRLPEADYLPTWHARRVGGGLGPAERDAADKAAVHGDTPAVTHFDSLGRPILTVAHNRFVCNSAMVDEHHLTRTALDIEGKPLAVIDALGRRVMEYQVRIPQANGDVRFTSGYDVAGNLLYQHSMEAGERRMLVNVAGNPLRAWDSRGYTIRTVYDELQRPAQVAVRDSSGAERLAERTVYGETQGTANNHRGQVFQQYDGAGVITNEAYDFKGNLLRSSRRLLADYKSDVDWSVSQLLENETFTSSTTFDALNRPVALIAPDNSLIRLAFNEANLLERIEANLQGSSTVTTFISDIDYNAKGQRERITYATIDDQGVTTEYDYDLETFRLTRLHTVRGSDSSRLQDLRYAYDPAGNITRIEDRAQQAVFFRNHRVDPAASYVYDAIYRLIEATGREHLGQSVAGALAPTPTSHSDAPRVGLFHPGDRNAMELYTETYTYDLVGNIEQLAHRGTDPVHPGWNRSYAYNEPSLIEPGSVNNRLSSTTVGGVASAYTHDPHGNMTSMPHLARMAWDYQDQLREVDLGGGGTAYYQYDADGQRVRKVIERQNGTRQKERLYLGGFEKYREYNGSGNTVTLERETLHIMDDQQRIAVVETRTQGNDGSPAELIRYQFGNHLGSASLEVDDGGQIISYEEYYPYGSTSYQAVGGQTETPKRYRYTGKERDEESGLYYHSARYQAPWLCRWLSPDPAGMVDARNLYVYVQNNPIRFFDPSGRNLQETLNQVGQALEEAETTLTRVDIVRNRLATAVSEYNQALPQYLEASRRGDIAETMRFGNIVERNQAVIRNAGAEIESITTAIARQKQIGDLTGTLDRAIMEEAVTVAEFERLVEGGELKRLERALLEVETGLQQAAEEILPELRANQRAAARLTRDFQSLEGSAAGRGLLAGRGSALARGIGIGALTALLGGLVNTPVRYGAEGNVELEASAMLEPHHLGEGLRSEDAYFFAGGPRPGHLDPNRKSPEVPVALTTGIGFQIGGPLGALVGAILGTWAVTTIYRGEEQRARLREDPEYRQQYQEGFRKYSKPYLWDFGSKI
jgi:RHS repeat-associated protein